MEKSDINIHLDFTKDSVKNNIKGDPDIFNNTLRIYQKELYSREKLCLDFGNRMDYDYLIYKEKNIRFASDCIINMNEMYKEYKETHEKYFSICSNYYKKLYQEYLDTARTIGGEIIFPKHRYSINQCRGVYRQIKDRFDLTLECIKRFYEHIQPNPLEKILLMDKEFFGLFGTGVRGFEKYVNFFFLDDLVKDGKVDFFFGTYNDDIFNHSPFAWKQAEWEQLLEKQMVFLEKRNKAIENFCKLN